MQAKPDPNFRPNVERSVYIFQEFNDDLFASVIHRVHDLRADPAKPITFFINSPGGSTDVLDAIHGHLRCKNYDGQSLRFITVVSGEAASSAAMLLAMGDYAIAYEHSIIHFHGTRFIQFPELTTERALLAAKSLEKKNRDIAHRCALEVVKRLAHRYSSVNNTFEKIRAELGGKAVPDVECFLAAIAGKISIAAFSAARDAVNDTKRVLTLSESVIKTQRPIKAKQTQIQIDLNVLRSLIKQTEKDGALYGRALDEDLLNDLIDRYLLLRDFYFGDYIAEIYHIVATYGVFFLTTEETALLEEIEDAEARQARLADIAGPRLRVFLFFTVKLCRRLHQGENRLTSTDAYWLGLVDEVLGTSMVGYRSLMESYAATLEPELESQGGDE